MRTCALCQQPIPSDRSGKAKYCTSKCSRTANRDAARPCNEDGCTKNVRARDLCSSHYNQRHAASRHSPTMTPCFVCDKPALKFNTNNKARASVCSDECRRTLTFGTALPDDHWARWWGKASAWAPPKAKQPKPVIAAFIANTCDDCAAHFVEANNHNPSSYCSNRCSKRVARRTRKAREHSATGNFRWVEVIRLWVAAGKQCSYCDMDMDGQPDPDHVVPISRGGRNDMGNIVPCCRSCNGDKGDLTLAEWADERARLGKPARRYALPYEDPRFKHLTLGEAKGNAWRHSMQLAA